MAIKVIGKRWVPGTIDDMIVDYVVDTDADFADLPTCVSGSKAVSAETGNVKIVNASGQWISFLE